MEKLDFYDKVLNDIIRDLFLSGNKTKEISFYNLSRKDDNHLGLLTIAGMTKDLFNFNIKINCSIFDYIYFKFKINHPYWLKRSRNQSASIDAKDFIRIVEEYSEPNIIKKIYKEYYKK